MQGQLNTKFKVMFKVPDDCSCITHSKTTINFYIAMHFFKLVNSSFLLEPFLIVIYQWVNVKVF